MEPLEIEHRFARERSLSLDKVFSSSTPSLLINLIKNTVLNMLGKREGLLNWPLVWCIFKVNKVTTFFFFFFCGEVLNKPDT